MRGLWGKEHCCRKENAVVGLTKGEKKFSSGTPRTKKFGKRIWEKKKLAPLLKG